MDTVTALRKFKVLAESKFRKQILLKEGDLELKTVLVDILNEAYDKILEELVSTSPQPENHIQEE